MAHMKSLFAEKLLVPEQPAEPLPISTYDEERSYTICADGRPLVEAAVVGSTVTLTEVRAEPSDDDRDYDRALASLGTITRAREDSD
jgi:hypothetical protein